MQWLNGKKTYLGMIAFGILGFAWSLGYVTDEHAKAIGSIVGAWTGVAMRNAWSKGQ